MNADYLEHVIQAKESLIIWQSNVEQIHKGIEMFSSENELDRYNTDFAKWYHNEGQVFSSFETFRVLEGLYDEMYDVFLQYNELKNAPVKKGLFSNKSEKRKKELDTLYVELKQKTRKLIKSVEIFEENLKNSPLFIKVDDTQSSNFEIEKSFTSKMADTTTTIELTNQELTDKLQNNIPSSTSEDTTKVKESLISEEEFKLELERKLKEEIQKVREELKKELLHEKNEVEKVDNLDNIEENIPNEIVETKEKHSFKPKIRSSNDQPDLDIDEEIRRILSYR